MTENNGIKAEKATFGDDSQMAALVDSWATRFGALAVLEVLGRGSELSDPFGIVLLQIYQHTCAFLRLMQLGTYCITK